MPKKRGPDRRFTPDDVFEAALRLVDERGRDALTMRGLAQQMGVAVMTLYGYVTTKDELLDGVGALLLRRLSPDTDPARPWDEQLEAAVSGLHRVFQNHPGAVEIVTSGAVPRPALDGVRETLLGILRGAGFGPADAVDAVGSLVGYAVGFAVLERDRRDLAGDAESARLGALPADRFPRLRELAREYPGHTSARTFEHGLRHLIAGLRTDLGGPA